MFVGNIVVLMCGTISQNIRKIETPKEICHRSIDERLTPVHCQLYTLMIIHTSKVINYFPGVSIHTDAHINN